MAPNNVIEFRPKNQLEELNERMLEQVMRVQSAIFILENARDEIRKIVKLVPEAAHCNFLEKAVMLKVWEGMQRVVEDACTALEIKP